MAPTQVSAKFFTNEFALFFFLTIPVSSIAKPTCMRKTMSAHINVKHVSKESVTSAIFVLNYWDV
jgi:hypothetical protein